MNIHNPIGGVEMRALEIVTSLKSLEGPLLPILHALQGEFGHVPQSVLPLIAKELNLSRAEVHGVMTFYHDFRAEPAGRHVLKLCRAEACQSIGGEAFCNSVREALGIDWHETTPDGRVTLEPVFCLGLCSCAPAAMLDNELIGRADLAGIKAALAEAGQ
ncbi:formate dehydrogenase subunit gamma [Ensifer adhaerens]|nr:formate dehydrogenase subunit gamma [Ensifer adhaerens]